jgi:nucleotide-binding universal stress UspA family protein
MGVHWDKGQEGREVPMSAHIDRRFPMVVAVDLSEYSDHVLVHAFDQAARLARPALHILTVVSDEHGLFDRPSETELAAREAHAKGAMVEQVLRLFEDAVVPAVRETWQTRLHVRRGRPEEEIIELAAEVGAELVVVGRFGHSRRRRRGRLGSIADGVVAQAECPVLVVTGGRDTTASDRQCPECVRIRAESDGERWFCQKHHSEERVGHSVLLYGDSPSRGGIMW